VDHCIANGERKAGESEKDTQATFAQSHEEQNAGWHQEIELLFNSEGPAPGQVLPGDGEQIVDVDGVRPEVDGIRPLGPAGDAMKEIEAQHHHGGVDGNETEKSPYVEAREGETAGCFEFFEEERADEESADDKEEVDAEHAIGKPCRDRVVEYAADLCRVDRHVEEDDMESYDPENRNGAHAVDHRLLEAGAADKMCPAVANVEIGRKARRGRSIRLQEGLPPGESQERFEVRLPRRGKGCRGECGGGGCSSLTEVIRGWLRNRDGVV